MRILRTNKNALVQNCTAMESNHHILIVLLNYGRTGTPQEFNLQPVEL